ncbi:UPF0149 family protein [Inhella gelatinilytica]|uniref:YecA family protein n=1 Tax=Inhella gelatinilytica TaxID=2795030 RepID=A0A931IUX2_9BURK|nr:UPF0149 family protein [Inhella gelatinilytica]MBH9552402.1 YecA family protein [Inhella gelatinilytica]
MQLPHYQANGPIDPLSDEELGELDDALTDLPRGDALNIEALDGYLCALLLAPQPVAQVAPEVWMPPIWGGDAPDPFASGKQRKRAVLAILRHLRALDADLHDHPERWEPILSLAEDERGERVDATDWCAGFLLGMAVDAPGWSARTGEAAWQELMAAVQFLGADDEALSEADRQRRADLPEVDALSRRVPECVLALAAN